MEYANMKKTMVLLTLLILITNSLYSGQPYLSQGFGAQAIVIDNANTIYAWGANSWGELGDNSLVNRGTPVLVDTNGVLAGKNITSVARGSYFTVALAEDNQLYAWGNNTYGQFGNNTSDGSSSVAVEVDMTGVLAGKTITAISAGAYHTVALDSDGKVYAWGHNSYGQLGNNSNEPSSVPIEVDMSGLLAGKTITAISAGQYFTLALDSNGKVYSWGRNNWGQLGINSQIDSNFPRSVVDTGVLSGKIITTLSAGEEYSLVLDSDGKAYSWGKNNYGQLGDFSSLTRKTPVNVFMYDMAMVPLDFIEIAAGRTHSTALSSNNRAYTWGQNNVGQLGTASISNYTKRAVAVDTSGVLLDKDIIGIASGSGYSLVMDSDYNFYAWGHNYYGQLGNNDIGTNSFVPVSVVNSDNTEFALPVTLTYFTAQTNNGLVELTWETATETNNARFVIYRDGVSIGSVDGAGTTTEPHHYSFVDNSVIPGVTYTYVLADIDLGNIETRYNDDAVTITIANDLIEADFVVNTAYPNPFNPITTINYQLPTASHININVYDTRGTQVETLKDCDQQAGTHTLSWNASSISSGIYLIHMTAGEFSHSQKVVLMK